MDLWDHARRGEGYLDDEVLEATSAVLSSRKVHSNPTDLSSSLDETVENYWCCTCQPVATTCRVCPACVDHHQGHHLVAHTTPSKTSPRVDTFSPAATCDCCASDHACRLVTPCAKLSLLDSPHPTQHYTALYVAARQGHLDYVKYLHHKGAHMNALTQNGANALHGALKHHFPNNYLVRYLLQHRCNPNQATYHNDGMTPLHLAASRGDRPSIINLFLDDPHCDPTLLTRSMHTAMGLAMEHHNYGNLEVFLQHQPAPSFSNDRQLLSGLQSLPSLALLLEYNAKLKRGYLEMAFGSIASTSTSKNSFLDGLFRMACSVEHPVIFEFLCGKNFDSSQPLGRFMSNCSFLADGKLESPAYKLTGTTLEIALAACEERKRSAVMPTYSIVSALLKQRVPHREAVYKLLKTAPTQIIYEFIQHYRNDQGVLDLEGCGIRFLTQNFVQSILEYNLNSGKPVHVLNLQNNNLQAIPSEMTRIPSLRDIDLKGNPIVGFHSSVKTWKELSHSLRESEERQRKWNRGTIMLIGDQQGVRSLWKWLPQERTHRQRLRDTLTKPSLVGGSASEDQFEIHRAIQIHKNQNTLFDIWRLQGTQQGFFLSSSLFLTQNTIFLMAISVADLIGTTAPMEVANINFWLQKIHSLTKNIQQIPVIFALFEDDRGLAEDTKNVSDYLTSRFIQYKNIHDIVHINSKGEGMDQLKGDISAVARKTIPEVHDVSWVQLHDLILPICRKSEKLLAKTGYLLQPATPSTQETPKQMVQLEWADFLTMAESCAIKHPHEALRFLSYTGVVIVCFDLEKPFIVLNATWLNMLMEELTACQGYLSVSTLVDMFPQIDSSLATRLIAMLREHSLCVPVTRDKENNPLPLSHEPLYLVPSMLPESTPSALRTHWPNRGQYVEYEYRRVYKLSMVPADFITTVIVDLLHLPDIQVPLIWRGGLVLTYTLVGCPCSSYPCKQSILVEFHTTKEYEIIITARCCQISHRILRMVASTIYNLVEDCKLGDNITRFVPCTHCIRHHYANVFRFRYESCVDQVANNRQYVYCSDILSASRRVSILTLAPDIMSSSIPRIKPSHIKTVELLGEGGFGKVYRGLYCPSGDEENELTVAIKEPHQTHDSSRPYDPTLYDEFMKEVQIMYEVSHPNIVELIGITFQPLRMILEFVVEGDLYDLLHCSEKPLSWRLRLMIAWDIAKGMRFLQSHSPPIIHRDLHAHNIFIASLSTKRHHQRAKIADFGLARGVVRNASVALSDIWLAPEVLSGTSYDSQSDVYSFGICCWQIATRSIPFSTSNQSFIQDAIVKEQLRPSLALLGESEAPQEFVDLITACWAHRPTDRPTFAQIAMTLARLLDIKGRDSRTLGCGLRGSLSSHISSEVAQPPGRDESRLDRATQLRFFANLEDIIRKQITVTCSVLVGHRFWIGTSQGDLIVLDAPGCTLVATKKAHSQCILQLLHVQHQSKSFIVSSTSAGHIRVWEEEQTLLKELKITKGIKDIKQTTLPNGMPGLAVIATDVKGRSFVLHYDMPTLVEHAMLAYENLPIVGYHSDDQFRVVFLLHSDGKISMQVSTPTQPNILSKIDEFYLANQITPLCPSVQFHFGHSSQFYVASGLQIHEYCFLSDPETGGLSIVAKTVEYYNSPIRCLALIADREESSSNHPGITTWSGHASGQLCVWSIKNSPDSSCDLVIETEIDESVSPHKKEVVMVCYLGDRVYSVSKDGIIACWSKKIL